MPVKNISSRANPLYKYFKGLADNKSKKADHFIIEGKRLICEAYANAYELSYIIYRDGVDIDFQACQHIVTLPEQLFKGLADTVNSQGVLGVLRKPSYSLAELDFKKDALLLIINGLQDPGNLGTIIRTASGAGVSAVLMTKGTVDLYNPKTIRATMGSIFHLPVLQDFENKELIAWLDKQGVETYVADAKGDFFYFDVDMLGLTAIVIGNENQGPAIEWKYKNKQLKIPLSKKTESLNASAAASILLYEAVRQ
jgi:TrmH family RNA methyltransferase